MIKHRHRTRRHSLNLLQPLPDILQLLHLLQELLALHLELRILDQQVLEPLRRVRRAELQLVDQVRLQGLRELLGYRVLDREREVVDDALCGDTIRISRPVLRMRGVTMRTL